MTEEFSVIMRCKNEERWIGHAIQSVIDFIPKNEIILVDNLSDDRSTEIAKSFRKDPDLNGNSEHYTDVKIIEINDYTPGAALNLGVQNAKYENLLILSCHCILQKFNVEQLVMAVNNYAAVFGNQIPVYYGKKINKRYLWKHFGDTKVTNMYSSMEERYFLHNAASVYLKETLLNNPFNENIVGKEDRYWANNIIASGQDILYDPLNFSVDHHYTQYGNTWKGIG